MIERYSRKEIAKIWEEKNKYQIWLSIEIAAAQAMEKPIIASNIGGSNETIIDEKTGFLYPAGNSNILSQKLSHIFDLNEETLKSMGIEGRKNVIKKFNVEKMCFSTYSEYKKLFN